MWADNTQRTGTRCNSKKLFHQRTRLDARRHRFNVRVVQTWNSLPDEIVCAKSLNSFKNKLDKYWENQEIVYNDYKSEITGSHEKVVIANKTDDEPSIEDPGGTCAGNQR